MTALTLVSVLSATAGPGALVVLALVGLIAGGFVTMVVDRAPDRTPLTSSCRCPHCETRLAWRDTVPVVSWVRLGGRCRHCRERITAAYPAVEVVTAALFVVVGARFGLTWVLVPVLVLVVAVTALSVIDLYVYRLPDIVTGPSLAVSLVAIVVASFALHRPGAIGHALAGAVAYFGLLLVAHLVSPRGMGFGDVKLAALLGLHLGWIGGLVAPGWIPVVRLVFYALLAGSILGIVSGVAVAGIRAASPRPVLEDPEGASGGRLLGQSFPFGPALAAGTVLVIVFADTILGV